MNEDLFDYDFDWLEYQLSILPQKQLPNSESAADNAFNFTFDKDNENQTSTIISETPIINTITGIPITTLHQIPIFTFPIDVLPHFWFMQK